MQSARVMRRSAITVRDLIARELNFCNGSTQVGAVRGSGLGISGHETLNTDF